MKTLIVYATKYGCTKECVNELYSKIKGEVVTADIKAGNVPSLKGFDNIIVGGSIYVGNLDKKLKQFMETNEITLANKNLWLFMVCGFADKAQETMNAAFPKALLKSAKSVQCFGGELNTSKMKFLHKKVVEAVTKDTDITKIKVIKENIMAMAGSVNAMA